MGQGAKEKNDVGRSVCLKRYKQLKRFWIPTPAARTCPADVESTIGALANLCQFTPDVMAMAVQANLRALLNAAGVSTDK